MVFQTFAVAIKNVFLFLLLPMQKWMLLSINLVELRKLHLPVLPKVTVQLTFIQVDKENENNITKGISAWLNNKEIYHTQLGELTLYLG